MKTQYIKENYPILYKEIQDNTKKYLLGVINQTLKQYSINTLIVKDVPIENLEKHILEKDLSHLFSFGDTDDQKFWYDLAANSKLPYILETYPEKAYLFGTIKKKIKMKLNENNTP